MVRVCKQLFVKSVGRGRGDATSRGVSVNGVSVISAYAYRRTRRYAYAGVRQPERDTVTSPAAMPSDRRFEGTAEFWESTETTVANVPD